MDLTRWERELPLLFTTMNTIVANTKADGTGTALTVHAGAPPAMSAFSADVYYVLTVDGSTASVVLYNVSGAPAFVTTMKVNGKPAREASPWSIVADDREAQDLFGVIPQSISNAYLPNADVATIRAPDILFSALGPDPDRHPSHGRRAVPAPSTPSRIVDDSTSPPVTDLPAFIRTSAGHDANTAACHTPALPAHRAGAGGVVTPPTERPRDRGRFGTWTWGPAGHPLGEGLTQ